MNQETHLVLILQELNNNSNSWTVILNSNHPNLQNDRTAVNYSNKLLVHIYQNSDFYQIHH